MNDAQYLILGLIVLAVVMGGPKLFAMTKAAQRAEPQSPILPPIVRVVDAGPDRPLDAASIAALLQQSVTAEAQTRAVRRSVESMIETQSRQVQLTWAGPSPAPAPSDPPKA